MLLLACYAELRFTINIRVCRGGRKEGRALNGSCQIATAAAAAKRASFSVRDDDETVPLFDVDYFPHFFEGGDGIHEYPSVRPASFLPACHVVLCYLPCNPSQTQFAS